MNNFPIDKFEKLSTPFYFYDMDLLQRTLDTIKDELTYHNNFVVHYAVKANANPALLRAISAAGFGADCVSGGEIELACRCGFRPETIVFAGVGKSDREIALALERDIFCFNVESIPELEVINNMAGDMGKVAKVAFRINPNVDAHTHANITTGLPENKFGIPLTDTENVIHTANLMNNVEFVGLHFHIGSQVLEMKPFATLCKRINNLLTTLEERNIRVKNINVGGGLGINYDNPDDFPIPDFKRYFEVYAENLELREGQTLHFEPGRSIVGQCGSLITRVLFIKQGEKKTFAIVDAGMTDLIRPALYDAYHRIENISSEEGDGDIYDVVGPICESSDVFGKKVRMQKSVRGDLIAIRSAGAYGEVMASGYNCRPLPIGYTSDKL